VARCYRPEWFRRDLVAPSAFIAPGATVLGGVTVGEQSSIWYGAVVRGDWLVIEEIRAISTNFRHNHQIRISPIRLIDHNENQVGIISTNEALKMAQEAGLDLVEVAPTAKPPVCRIMDYGKWRYQQQKKEDKICLLNNKRQKRNQIIRV